MSHLVNITLKLNYTWLFKMGAIWRYLVVIGYNREHDFIRLLWHTYFLLIFQILILQVYILQSSLALLHSLSFQSLIYIYSGVMLVEFIEELLCVLWLTARIWSRNYFLFLLISNWLELIFVWHLLSFHKYFLQLFICLELIVLRVIITTITWLLEVLRLLRLRCSL